MKKNWDSHIKKVNRSIRRCYVKQREVAKTKEAACDKLCEYLDVRKGRNYLYCLARQGLS